jgi:hypothetical protein
MVILYSYTEKLDQDSAGVYFGRTVHEVYGLNGSAIIEDDEFHTIVTGAFGEQPAVIEFDENEGPIPPSIHWMDQFGPLHSVLTPG